MYDVDRAREIDDARQIDALSVGYPTKSYFDEDPVHAIELLRGDNAARIFEEIIGECSAADDAGEKFNDYMHSFRTEYIDRFGD